MKEYPCGSDILLFHKKRQVWSIVFESMFKILQAIQIIPFCDKTKKKSKIKKTDVSLLSSSP